MPSVASALVLGQKGVIKPAGQIPAGIYETPQAILPTTANATTAYFTRAGLPPRGVQIDQYISFDGGKTWDYAGGGYLEGGVHTHRSGQITAEASLYVDSVPAEKAQARLHKTLITSQDPHDITISLKADLVNPKQVLNTLIAGMK